MTITVLLFGVAKEISGRSSVVIELPSPSTVDELKALLEQRFPRLKQLASDMIAVNNEYASAGNIIQEHDEVAVIPPVSGG